MFFLRWNCDHGRFRKRNVASEKTTVVTTTHVDLLGLDLPLLNLNLVAAEHDRDVLADAAYRLCQSAVDPTVAHGEPCRCLRLQPEMNETHRVKSRCQFGTFLYVIREVTSNMMIAHSPWML